MTGIKAQPASANLQIHRFASVAFMGFLPLVATLASDGSRRPTYSDSKPTRTLPPPA
jgi:hypothetical protein